MSNGEDWASRYFEQHYKQMESFERRMHAVEAKSDSVSRETAAQGARLDDLTRHVTSVERSVERLRTELTSEVHDMHTELSDTASEMRKAHEQEMAEIRKATSSTAIDVSNLKGKIVAWASFAAVLLSAAVNWVFKLFKDGGG